jgi:hypothetical protein
MKKIFSFIAFLLMIHFVQSQDSWTVKLNNKLLLNSSKEDEQSNIKKISRIEWRKSGNLEITYKEAEKSAFYHSFLLFDENDNQIMTRDSVLHAKIAITSLRKLFTGKKKIVIYTVVSPRNPMMAVRVRRIHLCTLLLP